MAPVIRSRGRTSIGAATVPGGSLAYINQAGASGRAAMQMGKALSNVGENLAKVYKALDDTQEKEQSLINLNEAKAMWNSVSTSVHSSAINGGVGEIRENGEYEYPWLPEQYGSNMEDAFQRLGSSDQYINLLNSLSEKDRSQFNAWSTSKYGELSGKVISLGYKKRDTLQRANRAITANNLFQVSLTPDPESSGKNYIAYLENLYERSMYGTPLSEEQIKSNERTFIEHYTLTNLFGGANPDIPESEVTIEQYDNAIEKLLDKDYLPVVDLGDDVILAGLSIEERTSIVENLKERKRQKEAVNKRVITENNYETAQGLQDRVGTLTLKELDNAVRANPDFVGTPQYTYFRARIRDRIKTGITPKEDVAAYRKARSELMKGEAIPNLAQKYRQDPTGTIVEVQGYLIENVPNLSDSHYSNAEQMLKNYFGKDAPLNVHISRLDTLVESRLKLKLYAERKGEAVDFSSMAPEDVQSMLLNLMNESEQTKAEIQAQVDEYMVKWDVVRDARLNADKSGKAWVELLDAPAIGSDGKVITGTENPDYIGERMMNSFVNGAEYTSAPPVEPPPSQVGSVSAINTVSARWNSGYLYDIDLQDGRKIEFLFDNMERAQAYSMFWNDVAEEMYGKKENLIVFDDPKNAPVGWKNGREPLDHLTSRLK